MNQLIALLALQLLDATSVERIGEFFLLQNIKSEFDTSLLSFIVRFVASENIV